MGPAGGSLGAERQALSEASPSASPLASLPCTSLSLSANGGQRRLLSGPCWDPCRHGVRKSLGLFASAALGRGVTSHCRREEEEVPLEPGWGVCFPVPPPTPKLEGRLQGWAEAREVAVP